MSILQLTFNTLINSVIWLLKLRELSCRSAFLDRLLEIANELVVVDVTPQTKDFFKLV